MVNGGFSPDTQSMSAVGLSQGGLLMWADEAKCLDQDVSIFFEIYEDNPKIRQTIDAVCSGCPVRRRCFAQGISAKEYGVWGGVYLEEGQPSREFNNHKTKDDWQTTWRSLTME